MENSKCPREGGKLMVIDKGVMRAWPRETIRMRIERSLAMLFLHGVITEDERVRIRRRLGPFSRTEVRDGKRALA
jgi:hypothetical protein